jgi:hypothetical protein
MLELMLEPFSVSSQDSHVTDSVLGRQANLKELLESKRACDLRLQVLVVIANDACESKKEIISS